MAKLNSDVTLTMTLDEAFAVSRLVTQAAKRTDDWDLCRLLDEAIDRALEDDGETQARRDLEVARDEVRAHEVTVRFLRDELKRVNDGIERAEARNGSLQTLVDMFYRDNPPCLVHAELGILRDEGMIPAIKAVRARLSCDLKTAKGLVDDAVHNGASVYQSPPF